MHWNFTGSYAHENETLHPTRGTPRPPPGGPGALRCSDELSPKRFSEASRQSGISEQRPLTATPEQRIRFDARGHAPDHTGAIAVAGRSCLLGPQNPTNMQLTRRYQGIASQQGASR